MALVAVASDKGAPGVTTASVVLAAVWPRPVLLAECDPAGGDLLHRFPAADGGRLDPGRGLLSLAVAARRGLRPEQVWEHTQTLRGGLAVLTGVSTAEQGAGLDPLWGPAGAALARLPQGDVIADCGRIGVDGPPHDLLAQAAAIVLLTRHDLGEVVRLRERVPALAAALDRRDRMSTTIGVVVIADHRRFHAALAEVGAALGHGKGPVSVAGGLAHDPRAARQLRGEWGGRLDKSLLACTARDVAGHLAGLLPALSMPFSEHVPASQPGRGRHAGQPGVPVVTGHLIPGSAAQVEVALLGRTRVNAPGMIEPERLGLATELVVFLATHPGGVHPNVLAAAIWPRGVTREVRDAALARARDWLGTDDIGRPQLATDASGRLRLGSRVRVDWQVFCALLGRAAEGARDEEAALEQALSLVSGPLMDGREPGRYAWLAGDGLEYEVAARVADAAHRLSRLRLAQGDPGGAMDAARSGLRLAFDDELLWRDLLAAAHASGREHVLRAAVAEVCARTALDEVLPRMAPETEALIDELLPSWRSSVG